MLRWVTPIKNMARTATRDVELRGQHDRGGAEAAAALPVGQPRRGPVRRPVHASTSPARRTSTSRSASAPTSASATRLARLELQVMFEQLLDRLPGPHLVDAAEPEHRPANFVSGYETMKVELLARRHEPSLKSSTIPPWPSAMRTIGRRTACGSTGCRSGRSRRSARRRPCTVSGTVGAEGQRGLRWGTSTPRRSRPASPSTVAGRGDLHRRGRDDRGAEGGERAER